MVFTFCCKAEQSSCTLLRTLDFSDFQQYDPAAQESQTRSDIPHHSFSSYLLVDEMNNSHDSPHWLLLKYYQVTHLRAIPICAIPS